MVVLSWYRIGGWNKKKDSVTKYRKIDSYSIREDTGIVYIEDLDSLTMRTMGGPMVEVSIEHVPLNYGGFRTYFVCPHCFERARFLYMVPGSFKCRKCANLNYPSQQIAKGSSQYYYKVLEGLKEFGVDGGHMSMFEIPYYTPQRPRYMHEKTYRKKWIKLLRNQKFLLDAVEAELYSVLAKIS